MSPKVAFLSFAIFLLTLLYSCDFHPQQQNFYHQLSAAQWDKKDTLSYNFFVPRGGCTIDITLFLRLNSNYEWLQLPLGYQIKNNFGYLSEEKLSLNIASKAGDFSNFKGSYRQFQSPLPSSFTPPIAGIYRINLYPLIEIPRLYGVENVGITIQYPNS